MHHIFFVYTTKIRLNNFYIIKTIFKYQNLYWWGNGNVLERTDFH